MSRYYENWAPYVPVAERRRAAARKSAELAKKGHHCEPVNIEGRAIAKSFWGKAWCDNLESYGDYESRLPRGRTYVRNGSVMDLRITSGGVEALVSGSSIYKVQVDVKPLPGARWQALLKECAGRIGSLIELLQGRLSDSVMQLMTRQNQGLFPAPREIDFTCSCPDGAYLCKHIAAALYGVGARLDGKPELLFLLRGVDPADLIAQAAQADFAAAPAAAGQRLENADLASLFGIDLDDGDAMQAEAPAPAAGAGKGGRGNTEATAAAEKPARAKKPLASTKAAPAAAKPAAKTVPAKPAKAPVAAAGAAKSKPAAAPQAAPAKVSVKRSVPPKSAPVAAAKPAAPRPALRSKPDPEVPMRAGRTIVASKSAPAKASVKRSAAPKIAPVAAAKPAAPRPAVRSKPDAEVPMPAGRTIVARNARPAAAAAAKSVRAPAAVTAPSAKPRQPVPKRRKA